jgi:hypothetical protein
MMQLEHQSPQLYPSKALCHICTIKNPLPLPFVMQVVKILLSLIEIHHKSVKEPCRMSYGCKLCNANLSMEGEEHQCQCGS